MNIELNNQLIETEDRTTVYDLLQRHFLPQAGIAVAVNNCVVPKPQWESRRLEENDKVIVIQAACGG